MTIGPISFLSEMWHKFFILNCERTKYRFIVFEYIFLNYKSHCSTTIYNKSYIIYIEPSPSRIKSEKNNENNVLFYSSFENMTPMPLSNIHIMSKNNDG